MKAPVKSANFDPVPEGNHVVRLYSLIHIGTVEDTYLGAVKQVDKVRLTWELCHEKKEFKEGEGEKPFSISREITLSMHSKATLRTYIEALEGHKLTDEEAAEYELESAIGKACLLNVVHEQGEDRIYAKAKTASPLVKGMDAPEMVNTPVFLDVNTITEEELFALPEWLREKIEKSLEWYQRKNADEEVPFEE